MNQFISKCVCGAKLAMTYILKAFVGTDVSNGHRRKTIPVNSKDQNTRVGSWVECIILCGNMQAYSR